MIANNFTPISSTLIRIIRFIKKIFRGPHCMRGKNNVCVNNGNFKNVRFDIEGDNNSIFVDAGSSIRNTLIYIRGNNHILKFGKCCYFKAGELWFEDHDCKILFSDNCTVEEAHIAVTEPFSEISFGYDCMLAKEIQVRSGDSHSIIDSTTKKRINYASNVVVGNHVWIGTRAILLKGANIGDNSIIGTCSLVSGTFPGNVMIAGIPAKVKRIGVDWSRDRIYE